MPGQQDEQEQKTQIRKQLIDDYESLLRDLGRPPIWQELAWQAQMDPVEMERFIRQEQIQELMYLYARKKRRNRKIQ